VIMVMTALLTLTEPFAFRNLLFEVVSAMGTVGLSTGITPNLSTAGKILIMATMFIGRLGMLTFAVSMVRRQQPSTYHYPEEAIRIG
jgi:trk system potassium uptake protein